MTNSPKPPLRRHPTPFLVPVAGGGAAQSETLRHAPRPPGHLSLRRAAEMVEGAAYDLAGQESPVFISRLIEIAAELERHASAPPGGSGRLTACID